MREFLKKHREFLLYAAFGVGTVAADMGTYALTVEPLGIRRANALGWCAAVLFAFFTNKYFVFQKRHEGLSVSFREFLEFVGARLLSLGVQVFGMEAMVKAGLDRKLFGVQGGVAKVLITVVVILINYIFSKFLIFRRKKEST